VLLTEGGFDAPIRFFSGHFSGARLAVALRPEPSCCPAGRPLGRLGPCARASAQR
jgi:hypothetical protein